MGNVRSLLNQQTRQWRTIGRTLDRREFLKAGSVALVAAAAPAWSEAVVMKGGASENAAVFPFGCHIYREPSLPMEQLLADLPLLKRLGFTMVKLQESWAYDEREEGRIDLSKVIRLVEGARRNGLGVYFGVTMEQAPMWFWRKYPDTQMVLETGQTHVDPSQYLLPSDGKPGPCWHHPEARAAAVKFLTEVVRQVGVYDNILVWNVRQEILLDFDDAVARHLCFCPQTLAAFRQWLRSRYMTVDGLNAAWRTAFGSWEEAEPPRRFTLVPSYLDWREFMDIAYFTDELTWKAEAVRSADPKQRPIMAHIPGRAPGSDAMWSFAEKVDVFGSSYYPGWAEPYALGQSSDQRTAQSPRVAEEMAAVALACDQLRSATPGQHFWAAELQGGRAGGGVTPGRAPDAGDIRRWLLTLLAGGAHGICFWNHRSEMFWSEGYGFGLLELEGDATERMNEASRIARAIAAKAPELFARGTAPPAEIAIVVDHRLQSFLAGSGERHARIYAGDIGGLHRSLWESGYAVDFARASQLAAVSAEAYKLLVVPYALSMGEAEANALAAYVERGGNVLLDAGAGRFDGSGFGMSGERQPMLRKLLGIGTGRFTDLSLVTDSDGIKLQGDGILRGHSIKPAEFLDAIQPMTAQAILRWNAGVYGTANDYGKGKAFYLGTLLGSESGDGGPVNRDAIVAVAAASGVTKNGPGRLLRSERRLGRQRALFLSNPFHEKIRETLAVAANGPLHSLLDDGAYNAAEGLVTVGPRDVVCLLYEVGA